MLNWEKKLFPRNLCDSFHYPSNILSRKKNWDISMYSISPGSFWCYSAPFRIRWLKQEYVTSNSSRWVKLYNILIFHATMIERKLYVSLTTLSVRISMLPRLSKLSTWCWRQAPNSGRCNRLESTSKVT